MFIFIVSRKAPSLWTIVSRTNVPVSAYHDVPSHVLPFHLLELMDTLKLNMGTLQTMEQNCHELGLDGNDRALQEFRVLQRNYIS